MRILRDLAFALLGLGMLGSATAIAADPPRGEIRRYVGHSELVTDVQFLPDGHRFVSSGGNMGAPSVDDTVRLWDVESGKERLKMSGHTDIVRCVAVTADGK